ncbi:D-alanyl-D-alanine carboxypeptidase [Acidiphilium sp. AL]|uniref:serine-type D-Ala-D-Ala carboxypeptidase n=2 Tax=Acidiphilium iwatense TaxID=768198 RepID=A0ABS9DTJ1_9PROT|nr:D-alanyl-D-alanine carboxypeptidase family protein [Acidiphilium sp. AL]MCF3946054.1 D-alanyl-D-alanine carboxypeptidase [Acidiphilium iwatense]MCU4159065.1 D-alanyl-D-alanine carboxypeptidase [Acidiphilium sp. AL]
MKRILAPIALSLIAVPALAALPHHGAKPHKAAVAQKAAIPAGPPPTAPLAVPGVPQPPVLPDQASYVLMDAQTGAVIAEKSPNLAWPPASLTKLMTAYLAYQAIAHGTLKMDQTVPVSDVAWHTGGSRMFISPSMTVTVNQLLHGLIIDSGNDAAVALAQAVAGSRSAFVQLMNGEAAKLHLAGTHYTNVDGLPEPTLRTTAMDVALLSRAIVTKYPDYLKISAKKHYTFDKIRQRSWNPVLFHDPTVDGLKTGRTKEAGHCIDATAVRKGRRLIAVVLGGPNWVASTNSIEALLDYGYQFYTNATVATAGKTVGTMATPELQNTAIPVAAAHDVVMTIPVVTAKALITTVSYDPPAQAGIVKGARVGTITVASGGKTIATVPAVAEIADKPAGFLARMLRRLHKAL